MLSPEFNPTQNPKEERLYNAFGFDLESGAIVNNFFRPRLIRAFGPVSSDGRVKDILTLLPSQEIDTTAYNIHPENGIMVVSLDRLSNFEVLIDFFATDYLEIERFKYLPRKIHIPNHISDKEKRLSYTNTVLPLEYNGKGFDLTKEVYSLHSQSATNPSERKTQIDYSLSRPRITLLPNNR